MRGIANQNLIIVARKLRRLQTPWETKLWLLLRDRRFENFKFRRQYPVGKYVADFCCLRKKLIIELDGSQHQNSRKDLVRDKEFTTDGYKVLRFWNNDLDNNPEGILQKIYQTLII